MGADGAEQWIGLAPTPGPAIPVYGFASCYLNPRGALPAAPATSVTCRGNGQNVVYLDWEHDTGVVVRWIKKDAALNDFIDQILGALPERRPG